MLNSSTSVHTESYIPSKPVTRMADQSEDRQYSYNEEPVKVIVIFDEGNNRIAIVENSKGEQFDVPMSDLDRV